LLTASNLGSKVTGSGFVVFLFGSLSWIGVSFTTGQQALLWTNIVLTFLNLFGIWRWLGRQAAVEQGAKAATEASGATPGEALFPASLLTSAKVSVAGNPVATCVDAMAGERTGRLAYIVVSEGGVAGVGERLRKLPWNLARVEDGNVVADLSQERYAALPEVTKDEWPAH
jgi:hypothetical protein